MRPRSFDETTVIDQLRAAFRRYGFEGLSLDQLSEATGLNRSSLYNAFGSKRGMMRAAVDAYCKDSVERFGDALDERPVLAGARRILRVAAGLENAEGAVGCLLGNLIAERAGGDPEDRAYFARKLEEIEGAMRAGLERAQADGALAAQADAAELAQYLMVTAQGLRLVAKAHAAPESLERSVELALETFARRAGLT